MGRAGSFPGTVRRRSRKCKRLSGWQIDRAIGSGGVRSAAARWRGVAARARPSRVAPLMDIDGDGATN